VVDPVALQIVVASRLAGLTIRSATPSHTQSRRTASCGVSLVDVGSVSRMTSAAGWRPERTEAPLHVIVSSSANRTLRSRRQPSERVERRPMWTAGVRPIDNNDATGRTSAVSPPLELASA